MAPSGSLPQSVVGGMDESVIGPTTFGLRDSATESLDCIFVGLASDGCNTGEGSLTVYVPPFEALEVWCVATLE